MQKYTEQIIRHPALTEEGNSCEILERITFERQGGEGGNAGQLVEINRRFDRRTGEPLTRLSETEFAENESGVKLRLRR